jgi:peptide/nickel transport system ATP-binding protein
MSNDPILEFKDVKVQFKTKQKLSLKTLLTTKWKIVLDSISFSVREGETFGIVGETGSGKTSLARTLIGIYKPVSGAVKLMGKVINFKSKEDLYYVRLNVGMVFQDPVGSLNPMLSLRDIISEGLPSEKKLSKNEINEKIDEISGLVGLPINKLDSFPPEISGGEKQRVSLGRALINKKKILILDEPTSSLDVSVQAQILNLLRKIKEELSVTYLFITHDFSVIEYMSDRVTVLYFGQILEISSVRNLFENPLHPYTADLISAHIRVDTDSAFDASYRIEEPSREGCIFINSCSKKFEKCTITPPSFSVNGRIVKCWLYSNQ